nr:MAG TPA: hypothetical protein [Caudoviricetes sp.]
MFLSPSYQRLFLNAPRNRKIKAGIFSALSNTKVNIEFFVRIWYLC